MVDLQLEFADDNVPLQTTNDFVRKCNTYPTDYFSNFCAQNLQNRHKRRLHLTHESVRVLLLFLGLKSNTFHIPVSMGFLLKQHYDIPLFNTKYLYYIISKCFCQSILFSLRSTTISRDRYYWHRSNIARPKCKPSRIGEKSM